MSGDKADKWQSCRDSLGRPVQGEWKHMDKNEREVRRRQEDKAFNRGLLWVAGAIVLELLMLLVNRYYIHFYVSEVTQATIALNVLTGIRIGGIVAGAVCLVWALLRFWRGGKVTLPVVLTLVCGALVICAHVTLKFQEPGVQMLFLLVPAWAGLALVYYLDQREFFLAASASGLAVLGLWFVRYSGRLSLETVLVLVGLVLIGVCVLWLKKQDGVVRRAGGQEVRLMPKHATYAAALASCVAGLVVVVAALVLGANIAYYLIFAMVAWLFGLLVYYTVKLM